jgi:integrase/recombinase XerD
MEEKIVANPMARIPLLEERPARPRALSVHEAEALIEVCYDLSPSTGFCAVLMIWQGLRVSNAVSVCYEDFDLERNELTISRLLEQATMKIRDGVKGNAGGLVLPLFPRAKEAFLTHMKLMRPKDMSQGCIVNIDGTQLDTYQARRAIKKASKRLGIYSTPHVLRATFASLGEEAGYSKEDIQRMLGHSSIQTTQRYTRRTAQPLFEKGQRLGFGSLGSAKLGDKMVTKDMEHPTKCDEKTTPKKALTTRKDR